MAKFESQSGAAAADTYETVGSSLDLDEVNDGQGVSFVDEMGARVMAERMNSVMARVVSSNRSQDSEISENLLGTGINPTPDAPTRIIGVTVTIPLAAAGRIENIMLAIRDINLSRENIFWSWDLVNDDEVETFYNNETTESDVLLLRSTVNLLPVMLTRAGNERVMPQVVVRGFTSSFGAGTVTTTIVAHLMRATTQAPAPGEPRLPGLPIPSR